jgi:hypothetical protein
MQEGNIHALTLSLSKGADHEEKWLRQAQPEREGERRFAPPTHVVADRRMLRCGKASPACDELQAVNASSRTLINSPIRAWL